MKRKSLRKPIPTDLIVRSKMDARGTILAGLNTSITDKEFQKADTETMQNRSVSTFAKANGMKTTKEDDLFSRY